MKKIHNALLMYGIAATFCSDPKVGFSNPTKSRGPKIGEKPKQPITQHPPRGTKHYFFNIAGEFSTQRMLKEECVFQCYALNDKNAKRKFDRWKNK